MFAKGIALTGEAAMEKGGRLVSFIAMHDAVRRDLLARDDLHIHLFRSEFRQIDRTWDAANVCSSYWRLYINNRDGASVRLLADGTDYPLRANRVHFIPAGVRFTCRCRSDAVIEHFYVHFDVVGLSLAAMRRHFARPRPLEIEQPLAGLQCDELVRQDAGLPLLCRVKSLVYLSLARLMESLPPDEGLELLRNDGPVAPAVRYIEEHLSEPLDTWQLADLCHFSRDHFIRLFRRHVGRTPAQHIIDRRVARAAERLAFTSDSIDAIAVATGFPDRFYLTRVFTRRTGLAPATYRRNAQV